MIITVMATDRWIITATSNAVTITQAVTVITMVACEGTTITGNRISITDLMSVAASTAAIIRTASRWKEGWNDPRIIPEEVLNPADVPTGSPLLNRITAISKEGIRTITPAVTGK